MTRVETGSRLHFGLLRPPPAGGRRGFGGCGLMVEAPVVRVAVEAAADWSASGPAADRALAVARRVAPDRPHRVVVEACPPEHVGLGVGTQLSLAVARAVGRSIGRADVSAAELARLTGRGGRSGIGLHGFEYGGFLVDGGKCEIDELAPLVARADFPSEWRMVLLTPPARPDWHGERERAAFAALAAAPANDALCRLVLAGMLPGLAERDLPAFGESMHEYNARAGEPFRAAQGGSYSAGAVELIEWLRAQKLTGVGQSSWGPTAFAVFGNGDHATGIAEAARRRWGDDVSVTVTAARNCGAT